MTGKRGTGHGGKMLRNDGCPNNVLSVDDGEVAANNEFVLGARTVSNRRAADGLT
jgi:hypothetical protein